MYSYQEQHTHHHSDQNVAQQILTTMMTQIVVDKITHHANPHLICCFFYQLLHLRQDLRFTIDVSLQIPFGDVICEVCMRV